MRTRSIAILSSGRTATKFLAKYLNDNYNEVTAVHEPGPTYFMRFFSCAYAAGAVGTKTMRRILRLYRSGRMRRLGTPFYVESNAYLFGFIDVMAGTWDDLTVVHIVRDPRTAIRSAFNHGNNRGLKRLANLYLPYWLPRRSGFRSSSDSVLIQLAISWRIINEMLCRGEECCDRYLRVKYEDLFSLNFTGLRRICQVAGLEFQDQGPMSPNKRVNKGQYDELPSWGQWSSAQREEVLAICGPIMERLGYDRE